MIIIQFETAKVGNDYVCTASCDGIQVANHLTWRPMHAATYCYNDMKKAGLIEKGTLCMFTTAGSHGIDYQFHHEPEKTNRKWTTDELIDRVKEMGYTGSHAATMDGVRIINFIERIQCTDMTKEYATSALHHTATCHRWNAAQLAGAYKVIDDLFE